MATGPSPAEPSITEVMVDASFSRSRLWTWAFEHLGGVFPSPLQRDASLGCMEMWTYFSRGGALSSRGGRFPMCRVRFFFAALDTCWPPQGTSARICTPKSHPLMPSPTSSPSQPLETLEVLCSHTVTLGHQKTQGGAWEASRKSRVPRPMPRPAATSPGSHRTDRPRGRLEGREEPCAAQPGTSWRLRPGTHFSEWTHGLACGRVFSQAEGPSPRSTALDTPLHQASGLARDSSSHRRWNRLQTGVEGGGQTLRGASGPPFSGDAELEALGMAWATHRGHACLTKALTGA